MRTANWRDARSRKELAGFASSPAWGWAMVLQACVLRQKFGSNPTESHSEPDLEKQRAGARQGALWRQRNPHCWAYCQPALFLEPAGLCVHFWGEAGKILVDFILVDFFLKQFCSSPHVSWLLRRPCFPHVIPKFTHSGFKPSGF